LAEEQDDNPRPSKAFYIVRQDKWGGEGPSSSVGALGNVLFIFFCQTGEGGVLLQQTELGQLAFPHHLSPALFTLSASHGGRAPGLRVVWSEGGGRTTGGSG